MAATYWESFKVEGEAALEKIKALIHEGSVRRIVVQHEGRTVAEFPLTAGIVGAVLAPVVAAVGALIALLKDCTNPGRTRGRRQPAWRILGNDRVEPGLLQRRTTLGASEQTQEGTRRVGAPGLRRDGCRVNRRQLNRRGQRTCHPHACVRRQFTAERDPQFSIPLRNGVSHLRPLGAVHDLRFHRLGDPHALQQALEVGA